VLQPVAEADGLQRHGGPLLACGRADPERDQRGLHRALAERGLRVPRDVSIVGFDDVPEAGFYSPPLTTVRQDFGEVGRQALNTLTDRMSGAIEAGLRGADRAGTHYQDQCRAAGALTRRAADGTGLAAGQTGCGRRIVAANGWLTPCD
jgi:Periplasmic binding protein-like domain